MMAQFFHANVTLKAPFLNHAPDLVKALLEAIAVFAAQGMKALEQKIKYLPVAHLLLEQMKK